MKKIIFLAYLLFLSVFMFSEEPPIKSGDWHWDDPITLNGQLFYDASETYIEQDGWAFIENFGKIHYWLYNSYAYWDGYIDILTNRCIPVWLETMGYVIDYDNIRHVYPNDSLASSVKSLMKHRFCDVSVALIDVDTPHPYVVINKYERDYDLYWTDVIPLIK